MTAVSSPPAGTAGPPAGTAGPPDRPAGRSLLMPGPAHFDAVRAYTSGTRHVELAEPLDLADPTPADVQGLDAVRDATAVGMTVTWRLAALAPAVELRELSHLHPPAEPSGAVDGSELASWHEEFFLGRCCWRLGPGFAQIRDRRKRALERYTITETALQGALAELAAGARLPAAGVIAPLVEERLVLMLGGLSWLAPYRLVRWPSPSLVI